MRWGAVGAYMTGLSKSISPFVELHKKPEAVYKNY